MNLNDVLKKRLDEAAWGELAEEHPWTLETLKKYSHKLDWNRVSDNDNILWTPAMLEQFKDKLNWTKLSHTSCTMILTPECLEQFANYWDWAVLSDNDSIPLDYDTIDRFIDKWDWANLIDQYHNWHKRELGVSHLYSVKFLERYADRIPADALEDSQLWDTIREKRAKELAHQILSGEV